MQRVRVEIRGKVQGVGFRMYAVRRARAFGLTGWVRNREDGSVEVEAEGSRDSLERLIAELEIGPAGAHVSAALPRWSEGPARYSSFEIGR